MDVQYRLETPADCTAIDRVQQAAFGREDEAALVDQLRASGDARLSLVAELDGTLVGHVLYSRLTIVEGDRQIEALALAPLAVLPEQQRRGIGTELVRRSLSHCRDEGHAIVLVLGNPAYYERFGFRADAARHLQSPYAGEHFQGLELQPGALQRATGEVRYAAPFSAL